jgi:hypothetical protein
MVVNRTLSNVTRGVDLLKPQMNLTYIAAGTVSIIVLMLIWKLGGVIFAKGSTFAQGRIPGASTPDYKAALGVV